MNERVKKEFNALKRLLRGCNSNKKELGLRLMDRAAFMLKTLEDLEEQIAVNGCISEYKNGENQYGTKKSPEIDVYNTMIKNYSGVIKQIGDIVSSSDSAKTESDGFDELFGR